MDRQRNDWQALDALAWATWYAGHGTPIQSIRFVAYRTARTLQSINPTTPITAITRAVHEEMLLSASKTP